MIDDAQIIDVNAKGTVTSPVTVTSETKFTMYVVSKTGTSNNHRIGLQFSPETSGDVWFDDDRSVTGVGYMTEEICAARIRAKVLDAEGDASTAEICILGR